MEARLITCAAAGAWSTHRPVRDLHRAAQERARSPRDSCSERAAAMTAGPLPPNSLSPLSITDFRNGSSMRALTALLLALTVAAAAPAGAADLVEIYRAAQTSDAVYAARARDLGGGRRRSCRRAAPGCCPRSRCPPTRRGTTATCSSATPTVPGLSSSRFNSNALTLSLTQPLYRRQNVVVYEQAKTQVAQADAVFALAAQDLILRVAQAYFDVLLAQNTVELAAAQIAAIGQQLEQAKRNFEVGTATITDTHDAQARYDLTVSGEIAARNDLEVKKRALAPDHRARRAAAARRWGPRFTLVDPQPNNMEAWVERRARLQPADRGEPGRARVRHAGSRAQPRRAPARRSTLSPPIPTPAAASGRRAALGTDTDHQGHRPPARGADLPGRPASTSRVREALANEEKARQDLENARRTRGFRHAPGLSRRHERHRAGQGARRGARLQPELARFHAARAGSRRENAGRRAERAAAALPDAARSRAGRVQLHPVAACG